MRNILIMLIALTSLNINAHSSISMHDGDEFETDTTGGTMINLPIQIDFDGSVTYGIGIMDHGGHGNHTNMNHGDMNHPDMDHNMNHDGGMNHGQMDHDTSMDSSHINSDMNQGMDHDMDSSMNHNSDEQSQTNHHQDHAKNTKKIMWHIMPMLHLGVDKNRRIISKGNSLNTTGLLIPADYHGGYLSIIDKRIEAGAGLMLMGMPTSIDWGAFMQIGFMPYKGSSLFSKRNVKNHAQAKKFDALKVPNNQEQLNNWNISDKLVLNTHGGLMFGAGFGATIFTDISTNYMTQGSWRIELEKVSENKIVVGVSQSKLKHIMYNFGATIISSNFGKHQVKKIDLRFEFDLSKDMAQESYLNLLQGDLTFAEELLENEIDGVKDLNYTLSSENGKMRVTKVGIPVLFSRNKMKMTSFSQSKSIDINGDSNSDIKSNMKMIHHEVKTTGPLSQHMKDYVMFMENTNLIGTTNEFKTASFVWLFERDKTSLKKLNKVLDKWNSSITSRKLQSIKAYRNKLGYSRAVINMIFLESGLTKLKSIAKNKYKGSNDKLVKAMLKSEKTFKKIINKLNNNDYKVQLKIQSEYFNSVVYNL